MSAAMFRGRLLMLLTVGLACAFAIVHAEDAELQIPNEQLNKELLQSYTEDDAGASNSWWRQVLPQAFPWFQDAGPVNAAVGDSVLGLHEALNGTSSLELFTDDGSLNASASTGRELLAAKKRWYYYKSYLPLNRKRPSYPNWAKYRLPRDAKRLPKHYVPAGSTVVKFRRAQKKWRPHSFRAARATYYGTNPRAGDSIDVGSCGYSYIHKGEGCGNNCLDIAAISDVNPEYRGSCGRCYEVGCQPAVFTDGYQKVLDRKRACKSSSQTLVVRITDTCPCVYPNNAHSNKRWCCGDGKAPHFDLSVNAFEKLANPGVGVIGLRYRIVPCWYQPPNIARRPKKYHRENRKPRWNKNAKRGWNWDKRVGSWVTKQRAFKNPLDGTGNNPRDVKPANVTGARASGFVPLTIPKGLEG